MQDLPQADRPRRARTVWMTTLWDQPAAIAQWGVVIGASLVAAAIDLRTHRIPNALTGPVFFAGLAWATWVGGLVGLADSVAACLVLALPYVFLFIFAGGGAGDAKMMGAIGAWLGLINGLVVLGAVALAGVVIALTAAAVRGKLTHVLLNMVTIVTRLIPLPGQSGQERLDLPSPDDPGMSKKMPYGAAIFVGVCLAAIGVALWRSYPCQFDAGVPATR